MITLTSFLVTLAILIAVHEYGHYRMAVACQVKVLRFSIGFGPVIWRRRQGADGCEFVLSLLPLGGYVRMLDEREAPVDPQLASHAYNRRPLWQRSAIVAAGPLANLLLAVVLYAGISWIGEMQPKAVLAKPGVERLPSRQDCARAIGFNLGPWMGKSGSPCARSPISIGIWPGWAPRRSRWYCWSPTVPGEVLAGSA